MTQSFILYSDAYRDRAIEYLARLSLTLRVPWEVVVRPYRKARSTEQNKRYWALVRDIAHQVRPGGKVFSEEAWHEEFKRRFIGQEEVSLPSGKSMLRGISTTTLDVAEFGEYMTAIEAWAAGRGVVFSEERIAA